MELSKQEVEGYIISEEKKITEELNNMLYRQKKDTYIRNYDGVGFILSTRNAKDMMVNASGAVFLSALTCETQTLDELVDKIIQSFSGADRKTIRQDAEEFYDILVENGFIVKGENEEEVNEKDCPPAAEMTSIRVYVTERCNANCPSCVNANARGASEMPADKFKQLCEYLSKNGIKYLKIMGGETTIHNDFETLIGIAQEHFPEITIFTNGINERIKNIKLREKDCVTYNFLFNQTLSERNLFLENGGSRALQVQVLKDCDESALANRIVELAKIDEEKVGVLLSFDCKSNIFKDKDILVKKLSHIENVLIHNNIHIQYDHKIPSCFLFGENLHVNNDGMCTVDIAGVIDSDLTLRYCNQNPDKILPLYGSDGFVEWDILLNHLYKCYYSLRARSLDKICSECRLFNRNCNGGCWITKDNIKREDIVSNTKLFP